MSSAPAVPMLSASQLAVPIMAQFPARRASRYPFSVTELESVNKLLESYEASASKRTPPSKALLTSALSSLLAPDAPKLARKWSKCQLARVLSSWVKQAMTLGPDQPQAELFVEVKVSKTDSEQLTSEVYINEPDGSVATFVVSPRFASATSSSETGTSEHSPTVPGEAPPMPPLVPISTPASTFSPSSVFTSASSFARTLGAVLAATPTETASEPQFHTPGVSDYSPAPQVESTPARAEDG